MQKVVGYVRVSSEEQVEEGISLEAQEAKLKAYAIMRGFELVTIVKDPGISAGKALSVRPGGRKVLDLVKGKKVFGVVAWKLDRLFRDCADCLTTTRYWDKVGVSLHLTDMGGQAVDTSSAMGRFFLTVMAGAAELERAQIKERTRFAMRHKVSKGEYIGGHAPYGYRRAGNLIEKDKSEAAMLTRAKELRDAGASLREVSAALAAEGFLARTGKPLAAMQIARMVKAA